MGDADRNVEQRLMIVQIPSEANSERLLNERLGDELTNGWRIVAMQDHNGFLVFLVERSATPSTTEAALAARDEELRIAVDAYKRTSAALEATCAREEAQRLVIDSEQENGAMWADKFNIAEAERDEAEAALAESRGENETLKRTGVKVAIRARDAEAKAATLRKALGLARAELARWGWGDHHYGSGQPQEKSVTDVLAAIDVAMGQNGDWRGRMANDEAEMGTGRSQNLRTVIRDGEPQWQLRCPGCGVWADIDDDQLHGRVSVEHTPGSDDKGYAGPTGCGYHETRDWWTLEAPHEST